MTNFLANNYYIKKKDEVYSKLFVLPIPLFRLTVIKFKLEISVLTFFLQES